MGHPSNGCSEGYWHVLRLTVEAAVQAAKPAVRREKRMVPCKQCLQIAFQKFTIDVEVGLGQGFISVRCHVRPSAGQFPHRVEGPDFRTSCSVPGAWNVPRGTKRRLCISYGVILHTYQIVPGYGPHGAAYGERTVIPPIKDMVYRMVVIAHLVSE